MFDSATYYNAALEPENIPQFNITREFARLVPGLRRPADCKSDGTRRGVYVP